MRTGTSDQADRLRRTEHIILWTVQGSAVQSDTEVTGVYSEWSDSPHVTLVHTSHGMEAGRVSFLSNISTMYQTFRHHSSRSKDGLTDV